jgi:hypothetical protein
MRCASRFAAKNNPLNFVPPLHEFFDWVMLAFKLNGMRLRHLRPVF